MVIRFQVSSYLLNKESIKHRRYCANELLEIIDVKIKLDVLYSSVVNQIKCRSKLL